MFRYHGMEYLQCGQCDGGETRLSPRGMRWMQTLRKLPTMQPKMKKAKDQKWNGTDFQRARSSIRGTSRVQSPKSKVQSPAGTSENSPAFQRWVSVSLSDKSRRDGW